MNTSIRLNRLSFAYDGSAPLFENLNLHFSPGWTGVVGPNGAGKSTLVDLIRGRLSPSSGSVVLEPNGTLAYCPQRVDHITDEIDAFANAWTPDAVRWMSRLDLEWEDLQRWPTLSPGERKRWQLGAALSGTPQFLLLDEPTNHLDPRGVEAVVSALTEFDGVGVVVSHDRGFLDALVSTIVWLEFGEFLTVDGNFRKARGVVRAKFEAQLAELESLQSKVRRLESLQADRARASAEADSRISARTRMNSRHDSDARSTAAKSRAEKAAAAASSAAGALHGRLDAAKAQLAGKSAPRDLGGDVEVHAAVSRETLGSWAIPEVAAGDRVLLRNVALRASAGDRVVVGGPNGAGKTTLIKALYDGVAKSVQTLYIPQEWTEAEARELRDGVLAVDPDQGGRILAFAATLGVEPDRLLGSQRWSPGETRKVVFARAFALGEHELLLLDEPTNHLDIPAIERIEAALQAWTGAAVIVSHDEYFTDAVATRRVEIRSGQLFEMT